MDLVYIVDERTPEGKLLRACQACDPAAAEEAMALGANVNWQENTWRSAALHIAASGCPELVRLLLRYKADTELRDHNDLTPLMLACDSDNAECIEALVEHGANVNAVRDDDQMSPLKFAVRGWTAGMIQYLLEKGASVEGTELGFTPLMIAARHNNADAVKVLLEAGANAEAKCNLPWANGATAEGLAKLEGRKKALKAFAKFRDQHAGAR